MSNLLRMAITVRPLKPSEWRTYRDVRLAALRDAPEAFGGTYEATQANTDERWSELCSQPSWFAFKGSDCVGMVRVFRDAAKPFPELISMWVAPQVRRGDAAARLVKAVLDWARREGDRGVYLRVVTANTRARRAYERLGFVANGVTDELPDGRPEIEMEYRFDD